MVGNHAAFDELVRRHGSHLRSLLRRMGAQAALADDLAQDGFIIAYERIETFRNQGSFYCWVARITARLYVKRWRADGRLEPCADPAAAIDSHAYHHTDDEFIDLDRALRSLPAAERLCIALCHGAGFSNSEVADELQLPLGTVKSHISRGLNKLRALLIPETENDADV
jgi:RNA polymerase sigma-70 factor (ECF subfamily)